MEDPETPPATAKPTPEAPAPAPPHTGDKPSLLHSLKEKLLHEVFNNWRLVLLGITGLVLSVASGWTTWDGMYNFTNTPALSLLITFGIQGVMLVTAWLIGESFATGATGEDHAGKRARVNVLDIARRALFLFISTAALVGLVFLLARGLGIGEGAFDNFAQGMSQNVPVVIISLATVLALALLLVLFSEADIIGPYARGVRTILSHLPLWVMFLACMATSVFFSFDSLFSAIFPEDERQRAGELRAQNSVSGIVADLGGRIAERRDQAVEQLFASAPWQQYERHLSNLVQIARKAPAAVEERFIADLKRRQNTLAKQKVSVSEARASAAKLSAEKDKLERDIKLSTSRLAKLQEEIAKLDNELQSKKREHATAVASAQSEARGVGSTGRSGKGPRYRELQKVVIRTEIEMSAIRKSLADVRGKFAALDKRLARQRARVADISLKLSELKAKEISALGLIKAQEQLGKDKLSPATAATSGFKALEKTLTEFRQQPTQARLNSLQTVCGDLRAALATVPALRKQVQTIDCDPGRTADPAAKVFQLNTAYKQYASLCGNAANLPRDTDALIAFAQKCVLMSGLPSNVTREFRTNINRIALNRDDKAHRFVVTWNAFSDGNKLAYLALAIAVAIDALVFMSGLFGANILTSPLAGSPKARGQPISQLQEIVDNALLPNKAYTAELTLNLMVPYSHPGEEGYIAEIDLEGLVPDHFLLARKVMVAGSNLGLVWRDPHSKDRYLIRSELFEYLSIVRAREAKLGNLSDVDARPRRVEEEHQTHPQGGGTGDLPPSMSPPATGDLAENDSADGAPADDDLVDNVYPLEPHRTAPPAPSAEVRRVTPEEAGAGLPEAVDLLIKAQEKREKAARSNRTIELDSSEFGNVRKVDFHHDDREEEWYEIREAFNSKLEIRSTLKKEMKKLCSGSGNETPQEIIDRFVREDISLQPYFADIEHEVTEFIDSVESDLLKEYSGRPDMLKFIGKVSAEFRGKMPAIILLKVNQELQDKAYQVSNDLQNLIETGDADLTGKRELVEEYIEILDGAEDIKCTDMMTLRENIREAIDLLEQVESRASA